MKYAVVLPVLFVASRARAEDRFRVGADASFAIADHHGGTLGLDVDVPVGRVSLRGRIERGSLSKNGGGNGSPVEQGAASVWRITAGVESRTALTSDASVDAFASFGAGAMRIDGGFLGDEAAYAGLGVVQLGLEDQSDLVRFRPALGLGVWGGSKGSEVDGLHIMLSGTFGLDVAF